MLTTILTIVLELVKIFFGKGGSTEKEQAAEEIRRYISDIRAALDKAESSEGDTSDLEKVVNKPKK